MPPSLDVWLSVVPDRIAAGRSQILDVTAFVRNTGAEPVDTGIRTSDLLVDGESSFSWRLAIGNGIGDPRETRLPPGEAVEFRRGFNSRALGTAGCHDLVLRVRGVASAPVVVQVDPGPD